jgi:hypothetical protein
MAYQTITPYADVSYGDAYFAERLNSSAWTGDDKEKALKHATRLIDQLPLVDSKYDESQARAFPRSCDTDGEVPDEVSQACCEVALALLQGKLLDTMEDGVGVAAERTGDASVEYEDGRGAMALSDESSGLGSVMAARMLAPWITDDSVDITRV